MPYWTPSDITTALWLDAADPDTITESSATIVSQWNDKSGNDRHFAQNAFPSARPNTGIATLNGKNVLGFSLDNLTSVDSASEWTFLHDGTKHEIYAVIRNGLVDEPGANYGLLGNTAAGTNGRRGVSYYWQRTVPGYVTLISNGGTTFPTRVVVAHETLAGLYPPNQFTLVSIYTDATNAVAADRSFYRSSGGDADATNTFTGTVTTAIPSYSTLDIGALGQGSTPLTGQIAEVIIIVRTEIEADRQIVEGYLAWKWGLQSSLPPDHPYKDGPLLIGDSISITTQPSSQSLVEGMTASFSVAVANPTGNVLYQWYNAVDDTPISGATSSSYSFEAALADSGKTFYVVATDDFESITSNTVTLTVSEPVEYGLEYVESAGPIYQRGTVVFTEPVTGGSQILVRRKTPIVNNYLASSLEPFQPEQFENQIDRFTMILQEIEGHACACFEDEYVVPESGPQCEPYNCGALYSLLVLDDGNVWDMTELVRDGPIVGATYQPSVFTSNLGTTLEYDTQVLIGTRDEGGSSRSVYWKVYDSEIDLCENDLHALGVRSEFIENNFSYPDMYGYDTDSGVVYKNFIVYKGPLTKSNPDPVILSRQLMNVTFNAGSFTPTIWFEYDDDIGYRLRVSSVTKFDGDLESITLGTLVPPPGINDFNIVAVEAVINGAGAASVTELPSGEWQVKVLINIYYRLYCNDEEATGTSVLLFTKLYNTEPSMSGSFSVSGPAFRLWDGRYNMDYLYMGFMPLEYDYEDAFLALKQNFSDYTPPAGCFT
jgi:hypothetical protein